MSEIINRCPICDLPPTICTDAVTGKPRVCCMNITCNNFKDFLEDTVGEAMAKWNMWAYKNGGRSDDKG